MNIRIIRLFTRMRTMLITHKELLLELEKLNGRVSHHSRDIKAIFNILKRMQTEEENRRLLAQIAKEKKEQPRPAVGFKSGKDKPQE